MIYVQPGKTENVHALYSTEAFVNIFDTALLGQATSVLDLVDTLAKSH